jgi:hypothetical protein
MFAKRRILKVGNAPSIKTPILLPSFSSKGFPNIANVLKAMEEYISDEILVSAYDLHFKELESGFDFASVIFLDSGGYEASKESELSETFDREHLARPWVPEMYAEVISKWSALSPTIFVSFDHPKNRCGIFEQVERAKALSLPPSGGHYAKSLLIKPETVDSKRVHLAKVVPAISKMTDFAVIGVTEKEIGNSMLDRMINVARLRQELNRHHPDIPIHVFGSLDTISTYLYFLAGADIFDGLTWLRYAFSDGDTIYRHSFGTMTLPLNTNSDIVEGRCWTNNYQYMQQMRLNMMKYLADGAFEHFGKHHAHIKNAFDTMKAAIGD